MPEWSCGLKYFPGNARNVRRCWIFGTSGRKCEHLDLSDFDGRMDENQRRAPSRNIPGGGSDFSVGARYAVGTMRGEATIGRFGGLAVFHRAFDDDQMKALHDAASLENLTP